MENPTINPTSQWLEPVLRDGKFKNPTPMKRNSGLSKMLKAYWQEKSSAAMPALDVPVVPIDLKALTQNTTESQAFRLGHSSLLLQLQAQLWLIDPVFSERASPLSFVGPKRFHPLPFDMTALPEITGVLISHDHYDHLDKNTIVEIHPNVAHFYVPLKVGQKLRDWGVPAEKMTEFTWWQTRQVGTTKITATPAHHFSGRGLFDGNHTLWTSWVIKSNDLALFYSGDSGYFPGFKEIGQRLGPFDMTFIETGAYSQYWPGVHMQPHESLQAHIDLNGKYMVPVHNSTFDLALHAWYEPMEAISKLAQNHQQKLLTPQIGEAISLTAPKHSGPWWRDIAHEAEDLFSAPGVTHIDAPELAPVRE